MNKSWHTGYCLFPKLLLVITILGGCSSVTVPSISLPKMPEITLMKNKATQSTPRALLSARIVNTGYTDQVPKMTVGKLIEYAERSFACECHRERFVKNWDKNSTGYVLSSNSEKFNTVEFSCETQEDEYACFVNEIENTTEPELSQRYFSGDDFIKTIYANGRVCKRQEPCEG
jgi:hypothetical protein